MKLGLELGLALLLCCCWLLHATTLPSAHHTTKRCRRPEEALADRRQARCVEFGIKCPKLER